MMMHMGMWIRILKPHERVLDWIERAQNGDDPEELGKDLLEMALDLVGCFDQTGISDAASALLAFSRGHWFDAGLSAIGIIPAIGDLAKAGKLPKYLKTIEKVVLLTERSAEAARFLLPALRKLEQALSWLPSAGSTVIAQIKQQVRAVLARNGARAARQFRPDISRKNFRYYTLDRNKFKYKVVEGRLGHPDKVLQHARDAAAENAIRKQFPGDGASHLAAVDFGASPGIENLSPQNYRTNRYGVEYHRTQPHEGADLGMTKQQAREAFGKGGSFSDLEHEWRGSMRKDHSAVDVWIADVTRPNEDRPFMRLVRYTVTAPDGTSRSFT
ncbi:MAG TPA: hypothetical protein VKE74_30820, partial [Gemmataceae bacterium]|nr:hypothetical protein [Gemmataceae bacterium]